jgi:hypothetical protein
VSDLFRIRCKKHLIPLEGEPKFLQSETMSGVWTYDLSEMYCPTFDEIQQLTPDDEADEKHQCVDEWVVELGKVDFVRRKEV